MSKLYLEPSILCRSHLGRPVEMLRRAPGPGAALKPPKLLILAAMHGDEPEGIYLMEHFLKSGALEGLEPGVDLYLVPHLNPDGVAAATRVNGRSVDLNRNFPTLDWSSEARAERYFPGAAAGSENETRGLMAWLERERPHFILNFHSWKPMVNFNGECRDLAEVMSAINGCPVTCDMGYPTPGSSGTWFWEALEIPSITLEIQEGSTRTEVEASGHLAALVAVIGAAARKYGDSATAF